MTWTPNRREVNILLLKILGLATVEGATSGLLIGCGSKKKPERVILSLTEILSAKDLPLEQVISKIEKHENEYLVVQKTQPFKDKKGYFGYQIMSNFRGDPPDLTKEMKKHFSDLIMPEPFEISQSTLVINTYGDYHPEAIRSVVKSKFSGVSIKLDITKTKRGDYYSYKVSFEDGIPQTWIKKAAQGIENQELPLLITQPIGLEGYIELDELHFEGPHIQLVFSYQGPESEIFKKYLKQRNTPEQIKNTRDRFNKFKDADSLLDELKRNFESSGIYVSPLWGSKFIIQAPFDADLKQIENTVAYGGINPENKQTRGLAIAPKKYQRFVTETSFKKN